MAYGVKSHKRVKLRVVFFFVSFLSLIVILWSNQILTKCDSSSDILSSSSSGFFFSDKCSHSAGASVNAGASASHSEVTLQEVKPYTVGYVNKTKTKSLPAWEYKYYGPLKQIEEFDSSKFPVVQEVHKMQTRLFTEQFEGKTVPMNECKHMLYDGLKNSQFLQLIDVVYTHKNAVVKGQPGHDAKDDLLWVIDAHHVEPSSCNILETMAKQTLQLKNNVPWHILAVDYGDNNELHHCSGLIDIIGTKHYRFAKRSIGRGREWVESNHFPSRGGFIQQQQIGSGPILHIPYSARSDLSTLFYQEVISRGFKTPLQIARTELDVAHFSARTPKPYFDNLRNSVNVALQFLSGQTFAERPHDPVKVFTGLAGSAMKRGRNQANQEYVTKMLQAKIVVVAQRDAWSGHYRLTEALLSGALIVADETVVLPRGFRDGESIVIFTSFGDLREKLLYFLDPANEEERFAVAQRGWEINQGYHRSWHVMEATVYGRPQTYVGDPIANFNSHTTT